MGWLSRSLPALFKNRQEVFGLFPFIADCIPPDYALLPFLSFYAIAEDIHKKTEEATKLEVIQVIGTQLDLKHKALEINRYATVITDKYIEDTQVSELTDVLMQTPSICVNNNNRPLIGNIGIRGFGNNTNWIVQPLNESDPLKTTSMALYFWSSQFFSSTSPRSA